MQFWGKLRFKLERMDIYYICTGNPSQIMMLSLISTLVVERNFNDKHYERRIHDYILPVVRPVTYECRFSVKIVDLSILTVLFDSKYWKKKLTLNLALKFYNILGHHSRTRALPCLVLIFRSPNSTLFSRGVCKISEKGLGNFDIEY